MAGKLSLFENVLIKLSVIPGLRFLESYVTEARAAQTRFFQTTGDYQAYFEAAQDAGSDLANAGQGDEDEEEDEEEDDEEEDDDEEDDEEEVS